MEYSELVQKYLSQYDFLMDISKRDKDKYPPWAIRKYIEMSNSLLHPDLSRELNILSLCTFDSVYLNRKILQSYFSWSYKLTTETSYSLVMYFAGEDFAILSPFSQLDGITYRIHNTDGPKSDHLAYDLEAISSSFREDIESESEPITIRVGKSTHKRDLIWFIKKYWQEIEPLIERPEIDSKQIRPRDESLRNIREYTMRKNKVPNKERVHTHKALGDPFPDYDVLNTAYKQTKPNAKKNSYDLFSIVFEQLSQSVTHHLGINSYILCLDDSSESPLLYLEHV